MTDIKTIPDEELQKDLEESRADILYCQVALTQGITTYGNHPADYVADRLASNKGFVRVILAEQKRRKEDNK